MPISPAALTMVQAGGQAASSASAIGIQRLGINFDYRKQYLQQEKLLHAQEVSNAKMMGIENMNQLAMWRATGPEAQVEQLKKAGLNPALLYGKGGGGGQSVGAGMPNTGAAKADDPRTRAAGNPMDIGNAMLMAAMIDKTKAEADNIRANTPNAPKTGLNIDANTANTQQETLNKQAQERLTRLQGDIAEIEKDVKSSSKQDVKDEIMWQAQKTMNEVEMLWRRNIINKATMDNEIETSKVKLANLYLDNELKQIETQQNRENITVTKQQIELLRKEVANYYTKFNVDVQNANTADRRQRQEEWSNDISKSTGVPFDIVNDIAEILVLKNILGGTKANEVKGFKR